MSILLEALKKSEQERQLGQTPTLQTHSGEQSTGNSGLNQWVVLSMVGLSVCLMAWFGWQQFSLQEIAGVPVVADQTGEAEASPVEKIAQSRTMTESYQPEDSEPASPDAAPSGPSENNRNERDNLRRSVSDYTAENIDPETIENEPRMADTAEPSPAPAEDSLSADADDSSPEQVSSREQGLEPHISEPISYWELPQGIRDGLPVIKITVLVYAARPGDRFLLSNGQRLVEKDQLEGGVILEEIRKDGAIFLYRNYRFLVKG